MDVAVSAVVTGVWWMSSATVLLPFLLLLKYNKSLRDRWFSYLYFKVTPIFEPKLLPLRQKAFELLKSQLPNTDSSNVIKILEIGIGEGSNLPFYPENSLLTALDMNPTFEAYFRAKQANYPHIKFDKLITAYAEDMKEVQDASMDVVISTYVLCSAVSVSDCLKEIKRVLKPGGKFLFLEHVAYPKSSWSYSVQKFANPLWFIYFDGCNLTRDLGDDVSKAGFSDVVQNELFYPEAFPLFSRPQAMGVATK